MIKAPIKTHLIINAVFCAISSTIFTYLMDINFLILFISSFITLFIFDKLKGEY